MKITRAFICVLSIVAAVALTAEAGTAFTYQGKLNDGGNPANGSYNLSFSLYDGLKGGNRIGPVVTKAVTITNGYFTTELDFGKVFTGVVSDPWLEIAVGETILNPRQKINPTPYAQYAFGGKLTLPYSGTADTSGIAFRVTNSNASSGSGAGIFESSATGVIGRGNVGVLSYGNLIVQPHTGVGEGDLIMKASPTIPNDPGDIIFRTNPGVQKARIWSWPGADGNGLNLSAGDNNADLYIADGHVKVTGKLWIYSPTTGQCVIALGEGMDYAEGFNVSVKSEVGPGTVLIIDAANPGKLALSTTAYDTKVAGIVAGAKGLGSGVRLGTGQFDKDVALAGRVYCNVDATNEAVRPGDLLTTSATPGHAMKVTEHGKAQGAILGKAMENLEQGKKGQILVLVTLQ